MIGNPEWPAITLENYRAVYDFYRTHDGDPRIMHAGISITGLVFHPHVSFQGGAAEALERHFDDDGVVVMASNHTRWDDPFLLAGTIGRTDELEPMREGTIIPAKPPLYKFSVVRRIIEGMGSVPVFRDKDMVSDGHEPTAEDRKHFAGASLSLMRLLQAHLESGHNLAIFPEQERNRNDPAVVQPLRNGVALPVKQAAKTVNAAILPIGIFRGGRTFRPNIAVGRLIYPGSFSRDELTDLLHPALQACVDTARYQAARRGSEMLI